jgi:hypothetical protein
MDKNKLTSLRNYNAYDALADATHLSKVTVYNAMSRRGVTYKTASRLAVYLRIPIQCFRIIEDNRGRPKDEPKFQG